MNLLKPSIKTSIKVLLFASFLFFSQTQKTNAQAIFSKPNVLVKSIVDFGGTGNDASDDSWAFIKASNFINNKWDINGVPLQAGAVNYNIATTRIRLEIPSGNYYVGKQITRPAGNYGTIVTNYGSVFNLTAGPAYASITLIPNPNIAATNPLRCTKWYSVEILNLADIDEIEIVGTGATNAKVIYSNNLNLGYFNGDGVGITNPVQNYNNSDIPHFLRTMNCKNLSVTKLELDGNNTPPTTNYGGNAGQGIQIGADGLILENTKNVSLVELNVHHMTREGLQLIDYYNPIASNIATNFIMTNCVFDNNRRNAFSWGGGNGINISTCKFNNTGISTYMWNGGVANGNPGAGIDIEPISGPINNVSTQLYCQNAIFTDCEAVNNRGRAFVNDSYPERGENFTLNNSKFHEVTGYSVWVKSKGVTFNSCKIWGGFVYGFNNPVNAGDETRFLNCDFSDENIPGVADNSQRIPTLVTMDNFSKKTLFSNCTFRVVNVGTRLFFIRTPSTNESDFPKFFNSTINYEATSSQVALNAGNTDVLYRCIFDGTNTLTNYSSNKASLTSKGLIYTGSSNACQPNSFKISGLIKMIYNVNGEPAPRWIMGRDAIGANTNNGYFNFNIGSQALVYNYYNTKIAVGSNSIFTVSAGGMMFTLGASPTTDSTVFTLAGKMVLESGSYVKFPSSATTYFVGTPGNEFYYHKAAQDALSPSWASEFNAPAFYPYQNTQLSNIKFDGGNTAITLPALVTSVNEALQFDGVDDYVKVPFTAGVAPGGFNWSATNPFSIEIAFKRPVVYTNAYIFSQTNGLSVGYASIASTSNLFISGPTWSLNFAPGLNDDKCHFLTITRSTADNKIRVYMDGTLSITSPPITGYLVDPYNNVYLGQSSLGGTYFSGWIGQVRLWSRELTQSEVCYNNQRNNPISATGLFSDWDMRDANGSSLANAVSPGSTTNGTLFNGPSWVTQNAAGDCKNASGVINSHYNFRSAMNYNYTLLPVSNDKINKGVVMLIYPNPNSGEFELKLNNLKTNKQKVILYSTDGKLIFSKTLFSLKSNIEHVKLSGIDPGVYVIKLFDGDESITRKMIVRR